MSILSLSVNMVTVRLPYGAVPMWQVCHQAQFYLRVVGREENLSFLGDKGFADFAAVLAAHGNILKE